MNANQAVGIIETCGIPVAIATADVLAKSGDVEVLGLENTHAGRISVVIRGTTGAVQAAIANAMAALKQYPREIAILGHHVIPCPDGSLDAVRLIIGNNDQSASGDAVEWLDD